VKDTRRTTLLIALALAALLVAGLAGQALADTSAPERQTSATAGLFGRAGFAYLTGLRTFGAAVLWNRLEPQFHEYYEGVAIGEQTWMLSTFRIVTWLDPEFVDAYYVASWILAENGELEEGLQIAEEGAEANPESVLAQAGYAQMLYLEGDLEAAAEQADATLRATEVRDATEMWESYVALREIYERTGDEAKLKAVLETMERLDEQIHEQGLEHSGVHGDECDHEH
jgi:tetratricopeptide (TPR) repeat protein